MSRDDDGSRRTIDCCFGKREKKSIRSKQRFFSLSETLIGRKRRRKRRKERKKIKERRAGLMTISRQRLALASGWSLTGSLSHSVSRS